jgi:4-hydroxy-tetrahydrodipicolinate synthase
MSPNAELHGVYPYLVSPVDESGRVNRAVLAHLVDHLIEAGVHGLTPLGSTGEFAYLDRDQRLEIVDVVVQAARGRVPVIAGVAATTIRDGVALTRDVMRLGADGVLAVLEPISPCRSEVWRTISAPWPRPPTARWCCTPTRSSSAPTCRCR